MIVMLSSSFCIFVLRKGFIKSYQVMYLRSGRTRAHCSKSIVGHMEAMISARGGGGGHLVSILAGCVCQKLKEMGSFSD